MKKIISTALISLFAVVLLAGCSQEDHKAELKQAFDNNTSLQSFRADISATVGIDATDDTESQEMTFTGTVENINNKKAHFEISLPDMLSTTLGSNKYILYTDTTESSVILYTYDGKDWAKQTTALTSDNSDILSPTASIDISDVYTDFIDAAEYKGEENVDDTACYKYELTLKWDMLFDAFEKVAKDNPELTADYDTTYFSAIKTQFASLPPVVATMWVDKAEVQLKQISIDATDTINGIYETYSTEESGNINKLILQMKYYDYNAVDSITIPNDALNAKEGTNPTDLIN